jgi:hypothetical protein
VNDELERTIKADQIKANEVGGTCGTLGRGEVWWESPKEGDHLEYQGVDGRVGLKWILGRLAGGV